MSSWMNHRWFLALSLYANLITIQSLYINFHTDEWNVLTSIKPIFWIKIWIWINSVLNSRQCSWHLSHGWNYTWMRVLFIMSMFMKISVVELQKSIKHWQKFFQYNYQVDFSVFCKQQGISNPKPSLACFSHFFTMIFTRYHGKNMKIIIIIMLVLFGG